MGDTRTIQGSNALMQLMGTVGQAMQRLIMIQSQNAEELEALAVKLVKEELGIPEGAMQFDAQLVMQPMGAAEGMNSFPCQGMYLDNIAIYTHGYRTGCQGNRVCINNMQQVIITCTFYVDNCRADRQSR